MAPLLLWSSFSCYIKTENENNYNYSEDFRCSRVLLFLHILKLYEFILENFVGGRKMVSVNKWREVRQIPSNWAKRVDRLNHTTFLAVLC